MFKEICKVTETDCFDSWKLSKSHLALEKKNLARKKDLILELLSHKQRVKRK
jgi:hypothetical protein